MFIFKTDATMKPYNENEWFIDRHILPEMRIYADDVKTAMKEYQKKADDYCISISEHALKNAGPIYREYPDGDRQIGVIVTGSTDFRDDRRGGWSKQYIDLWIEIMECATPDLTGLCRVS